MTNKELMDKILELYNSGELTYGNKDIPCSHVRLKIGGYFMSVSTEHNYLLGEISEKMKDNQIFTQSMLNYHTGRSMTFVNGEVKRGKYERFKLGKFKLYTVKNW